MVLEALAPFTRCGVSELPCVIKIHILFEPRNGIGPWPAPLMSDDTGVGLQKKNEFIE